MTTIRFKLGSSYSSAGSFEATPPLTSLYNGPSDRYVLDYLDSYFRLGNFDARQSEYFFDSNNELISSNDHAVFADFRDNIGSISLFGGNQGDVLRGGIGASELVGNGGNDVIYGGSAYSILRGNDGADKLYSGSADDLMEGGGDGDAYYVNSSADQVVELALDLGVDTVFSTVDFSLDVDAHIEILRSASVSSTVGLTLTGSNISQKVYGTAGDDTLDGKGGADTMQGFGGHDTYYVDDGKDVVIESANGGDDTVLVNTSLLSYALQATREVETLRAEDLTATTALKLYGNGLANTLIGNAGDNTLNGRGGGDVLEGGAGDDIYYVTGDDTVVEAADADGGNDSLIALTSFFLDEGAAVETLRLVSALGNRSSLTGNEFDQRLVGNASNNTLDGGLGNDVLQGGAGGDSFFFSTALGADNIDTIRDFDAGQDQILLAQDIFANVTTDDSGRLSADEFIDIGVAGNMVDGDDSIAYNSTTGALFYVTQGSGGPQLQQFAVVTGHPTLTASDFGVPFTE